MQGYALGKLLQCLSLLDFQKIMQEFVNFSIKLHDLRADVLINYSIEWHQAVQLQMEKKYCDPQEICFFSNLCPDREEEEEEEEFFNIYFGKRQEFA
jgi:hypothetical protein